LKCGKKGHAWHKCWTKDPVLAKVAAVRNRGKKRAAEEDPSSATPSESKKGKATVAGLVVPKTEGSVFAVVDDSDPEVYS
jgi:hypothetical protein